MREKRKTERELKPQKEGSISIIPVEKHTWHP